MARFCSTLPRVDAGLLGVEAALHRLRLELPGARQRARAARVVVAAGRYGGGRAVGQGEPDEERAAVGVHLAERVHRSVAALHVAQQGVPALARSLRHAHAHVRLLDDRVAGDLDREHS